MKTGIAFFTLIVSGALLFFSCVHEEPVPLVSITDTVFPAKEYPTMRVRGRDLYTAFNEKIILRGVNHLFIWMDKSGERTLPEIAFTGANAVRIVWLTGGTARELDTVIINCIREKMIPIVELHDATGIWEKLPDCVAYWTGPEVVAVIRRHQKYLLVNIGNEIGDKSVGPSRFANGYRTAVLEMRKAGIDVPLIIDAPDWGKNIDVLQATGGYLIQEDPLHNLMFSIHMWWPLMWKYDAARVIAEIRESVDVNLPLVVGEFGNAWEDSDQGQIPYRTIIEECQKQQVGWLAWSWGPGNNPQTWLNMTEDGWFDTLNGWGLEVAVTSPFGIMKTSRKPASLENILDSGFVPEPLAE